VRSAEKQADLVPDAADACEPRAPRSLLAAGGKETRVVRFAEQVRLA
jgi:hypothetical protein